MQQYSRTDMVHQPSPAGAAETGHYNFRTVGSWRAHTTLSCGSNHQILGGEKALAKIISEPRYMIIQLNTEFTLCCIISIILKRLFASPADNHIHFRTVLELLHITRNLLAKQVCKNHSLDLKNNTEMMALHVQQSTSTLCKGLQMHP